MNLDARIHHEQALLGTLLELHQLAVGLEPEHFLFAAHREIYQAMVVAGPEVCAVWKSLSETPGYWGRRWPRWPWESPNCTMADALNCVGGAAYLGELLDGAGVADDLPAMVGRVRLCPRCGR